MGRYGFEVLFLSEFFFDNFSYFKGRQALHTPPQVVSWVCKLKPLLTRIVWNYSAPHRVIHHGDLGLIVIGNESKSENFFKVRPREIAHFVGIVSGNKKHIHDFFVSCLFRAVEAVKVGK